MSSINSSNPTAPGGPMISVSIYPTEADAKASTQRTTITSASGESKVDGIMVTFNLPNKDSDKDFIYIFKAAMASGFENPELDLELKKGAGVLILGPTAKEIRELALKSIEEAGEKVAYTLLKTLYA